MIKIFSCWLILTFSLCAQSATELVAAARTQVGVTVSYDPSYTSLKYPEGDVPADRGVCTDVIIRAYRKCGADLQKLVHEDMKASFSKYPQLWDLKKPDPNIDHRRVPNLQVFFKRKGAMLSLDDFQPGDIVTCIVPPNLPHIMLVSDARALAFPPRYKVIHNIGNGAQEEDMLTRFTLTGHYRWLP